MEIKKPSHPPKRGEICLVNIDPSISVFLDNSIALKKIVTDFRHMSPSIRKHINSTEKKTRPAVIISNNTNNQYADTITVIPVVTHSG